MQNAIKITNGGTGRIDHQGRRPLVHRTGYDGPGKKKTAATGGRNAFLTGRFLPHRGGLSGGGRNGRGMRQPDHVRKL